MRLKPGSEDQEQIALMSWAAQYPEISKYLFANENGGYRLKSEAIRLKRKGIMPGVYDLFYPYPAKNKHGFFIEIKRPKTIYGARGRASKSQIEFGKKMDALGYETFIAYGWVEAANALIEYRSDLGIKKLNG